MISTPAHNNKQYLWRWVLFFVIAAALVGAAATLVIRSVSAAPGDHAYSYQFGIPGTIPSLTRSATAADGSVWVINASSNELLHISSSGERIGAISGQQEGQQFNSALIGVAVGSDGSIYALAYSGVFRFSEDGTFISHFSVSGSLSFGADVAVDSLGNVYVSGGYWYNQVYKHSPTGTLLATWGTTTASSVDGRFFGPQGLTVDNADRIYVADNRNNRVQVLDTDGAFLNKWSTTVTGPTDVSVDGLGNAYTVTSTWSTLPTVQVNDAITGALVGTIEVPVDGSGSLAGISATPDGGLYVNSSQQLFRFDSAHEIIGEGNVVENPENALYSPSLIAKDASGNIYVYDQSEYVTGGDYRAINKYTAAGEFIEAITIRLHEDDGAGTGYYVSVYNNFQIDAAGNLYFLGSHTDYDPDGSTTYAVAKYPAAGGDPEFLISAYEDDGAGTGYSIYALGLALDPSTGEFIVSGQISVYDVDGTQNYFAAAFDADGANMQLLGEFDDGEYAYAYSAALGPDGLLYFGGYYWDGTEGHSVWTTDQAGGNLTPLVPQLSTDGDVETSVDASSIGVDRDGNIYVGGSYLQYDTVAGTSLMDCVLTKFSPDGTFQTCIAEQDLENEEGLGWIGQGSLIVDTYGNVFALDQSQKVVKVYLIEPTVPSAPRNLEANPDTTSITITWDPPLDDGNAPITWYVIRARIAGGEWIEVAVLGADARSYTLTTLSGSGMQPGTSYQIAVFARNAAGESPLAQLSVTTLTAADTSVPDDSDTTLGAPNTGVARMASRSSLPIVAVLLGATTLAVLLLGRTILAHRKR